MTLPFYPFYWSDYSAKTFNLTNTQHGIYVLLLRNIYTGGEAMDTVEKCYEIAKASPEQHRDVDLILLRFFTKEKGVWTNKKALRVMKDSERIHQVNVIKGKKGGRPAKPQLNPNLTPTKAGAKQLQPQLQPIEKSARDAHEVFWEVCPKKVGKGASRKAWAKAILKTSPETIIAAMKVFASRQAGQDEKFIPHPATWLNAERWQDGDLQGTGQSIDFSSARNLLQRIGRA